MAEKDPEEKKADEEEQKGKSEEEVNEGSLDLAAEAGNAAAGTPPKKANNRSLDDIELNDEQRSKIDSYVNKAINDAVAKHDKRSKRKLVDEGYMTHDQVTELLEAKDAETSRRVAARERFLSVLGSEGITPGSEGYRAVEKAYSEGVEEGDFTPQILVSDAGIRTLIAVAGVSKKALAAAGPQAGTLRNLPKTAVLGQDGTVQLNAKRADDGLTLAEKMRRAMSDTQQKL